MTRLWSDPCSDPVIEIPCRGGCEYPYIAGFSSTSANSILCFQVINYYILKEG